jgi:hypothetical protein
LISAFCGRSRTLSDFCYTDTLSARHSVNKRLSGRFFILSIIQTIKKLTGWFLAVVVLEAAINAL